MSFLYFILLLVATLVVGAMLRARLRVGSKSHDCLLETPGIAFNESNIVLSQGEKPVSVPWSRIQSIIGYKKDGLVIDYIVLEFYTSDSRFVVNDEMSGFLELVHDLGRFLALSHEGWFHSIAVPAFETNLTLVYDQQGRTLEEVLAEAEDRDD